MSLTPGQSNASSRASSRNRSGNGNVRWADQTDGPRNNQSRGRGTQPKQTASSRQGGNVVPFYSWFSGITQFQKGKEFDFADGQGVPVANGIPPTEGKGYWYRHNRRAFKTADGQQKQLLPRWYFYYLGTGPHASEQYGKQIDGVVWVANKEANVNTPADIQDRDPSSFEAIPTRFPPGTVLPQGYYIEGSGRSAPNSRSGSRASSRASSVGSRSRGNSGSRTPTSSVTPDMADQIAALVLAKIGKNDKPQQVTKQTAKQVRQKVLQKPVQKRTPSKQCTVNQCFGKRGPKKNFGTGEMLKLGTSDPQFPILAELAPTPGAFFFNSALQLAKVENDFASSDEPQKDVYELRYQGAIRFDSTYPGFETIMKVLEENIDAYTKEQRDSVDGASRMIASPKPQRVRKGAQKNENVSVAQPKSRVQQNVSREIPSLLELGGLASEDTEDSVV
uniref:Nucleoprotein n=1 Tax=Rodent coronavirus TaxID=2050018 RepID=A0A2H4MWY8_9NIDO|nr:nucleocapsid protein [Rodent coronavirus]